MIAVATLLILCLDLISGQGTPKRLQIASMTAKIGKDGTDDAVSVKICSDVNIADCCSATLDKGVRKDEFVKSKTENWEAREFKECKNKNFQIRTAPVLTVFKNGGDNLEVDSIDFYMKTANQDQTRFKCEGFKFLKDCKNRPNGRCTYNFRNCQNCKLQKCDGSSSSLTTKRPGSAGRPTKRPGSPLTSKRPGSSPNIRTPPNVPPKDKKIDTMTVYLGADGTDDNVRMKVCSTDLKTCCVSDKLSHLLSSEWVKEKQEKWDAGDFGKKCKNQVFKVGSHPRLFLIKDGKDNLSVRKLDFVMKNPLNDKEKTTYSCSGFDVVGDCKLNIDKVCTKDLGTCLQKGGAPTSRPSSPISNRRTPAPSTRGPTRPPTRPARLPSKDQKIDKMVVNMGPDGTKDDVKIKICSDGNAVCCTSDKLSHLLSKEWVENKQETWESGKFGKCKKEVFKISRSPRIFVIKNGKDSLSVRSLDFVMKNPLNDKEKTTYSCNGFTITGDCSAQRNKLCSKDLGSCISSNGNNGLSPRTTRRPILPTKDQKIAKMVVNMGTDGTRDDVKMKICSEDNTVCCTSDKLSHLLSREWQENKQETWEAGKFGSKCKKQVFKVSTSPKLSIIKNGKDSMTVKSLDFVMKNPLNEKETTTYKCNGFSVLEDCTKRPNKECVKDLGFCFSTSAASLSRGTSAPSLSKKELKFEKLIVNMGPDGTKDDVHIKLCSQDGTNCCDSGELSHLLSSEWVKDKQEVWDAGDFGKCKKNIFSVISSPKMTVFKNGKDDLSVKSMDLVMKDPKNEKNKTTFTCSAFTITGDCSTKTNKECSKEVICFKK